MQHTNKLWQKTLSGFLAIVMVLTLLPLALLVPARAATDTITLKHAEYQDGHTYNSTNPALGTVYFHYFTMETNDGSTYTGLCMDHTKNMGTAREGHTWVHNMDYPIEEFSMNPDFLPRIFLDWYYYHEGNCQNLEEKYPGRTEAEYKELAKQEYGEDNFDCFNGKTAGVCKSYALAFTLICPAADISVLLWRRPLLSCLFPLQFFFIPLLTFYLRTITAHAGHNATLASSRPWRSAGWLRRRKKRPASAGAVHENFIFFHCSLDAGRFKISFRPCKRGKKEL